MLSARLHGQLSVAVAVQESRSDVCPTTWDLCTLCALTSKCMLEFTLPLKVVFLKVTSILTSVWIVL